MKIIKGYPDFKKKKTKKHLLLLENQRTKFASNFPTRYFAVNFKTLMQERRISSTSGVEFW